MGSFANRFSVVEQIRLGFIAQCNIEHSTDLLAESLRQGDGLNDEFIDAACKLRRAYRLRQSAMDPILLKESADLFKKAFSVNVSLREPLQRVAIAEQSYLPFWII